MLGNRYEAYGLNSHLTSSVCVLHTEIWLMCHSPLLNKIITSISILQLIKLSPEKAKEVSWVHTDSR